MLHLCVTARIRQSVSPYSRAGMLARVSACVLLCKSLPERHEQIANARKGRGRRDCRGVGTPRSAARSASLDARPLRTTQLHLDYRVRRTVSRSARAHGLVVFVSVRLLAGGCPGSSALWPAGSWELGDLCGRLSSPACHWSWCPAATHVIDDIGISDASL